MIPLWAVIALGWLLLAAVTGLLIGRFINTTNRKPPHVAPRKEPQRWPLGRRHY